MVLSNLPFIDLFVDAPNLLQQYPNASDPHLVPEKFNTSGQAYFFNCSFKVDKKTDKARLYWRSNRNESAGKEITSSDSEGVKVITRDESWFLTDSNDYYILLLNIHQTKRQYILPFWNTEVLGIRYFGFG